MPKKTRSTSRPTSITISILGSGIFILMLITLLHNARAQANPLHESVLRAHALETFSKREKSSLQPGRDLVNDRTLKSDSPPGNPTSWASPVPTATWQMTTTIPVTWAVVVHDSDVDYYYLWDQNDATEIDANASVTTSTVITGANLPQGVNWLHLRTRDAFENWAEETLHIGPFWLDTEPPTATLAAPSVTISTSFPVAWAATDSGSGVSAYALNYQRNDQAGWTTLLTETTSTTTIFTGTRGLTYTFQIQALDGAGNWSSPVTATTQIQFAHYLPFITRPIPEPQIAWRSTHKQAITSFVRDITLELRASAPPNPSQMKIWEAGMNEPDEWQTYNITATWALSGNNGLKTINVRFKWDSGAESIVHSEPVFFLQNGNFHDGGNGWALEDNGLPANVVDNQYLRLGLDTYDCNGGVPLGAAKASITLTAPPEGYELRFSYVVFTQDRLGGPYDSTYDSFDVYINIAEPPDILRAGNRTNPTNCPTYHIQQSGGYPVLLDPYEGEINLTFANWSRFDGYYNTYTELKKVWVEKK